MKRLALTLLLCGLLSEIVSCYAVPHTVTTVQITEAVSAAASQAPQANFLNYRVVGACFWWVCDGWFCHTERTAKVNEFMPDAVVSVYNGLGQNPWVYGNTIVDPEMKKLGHTFGAPVTDYTSVATGSGNQMLKFKNVDIVGDPGLSVFSSGDQSTFIPSEAIPLMPYYSSLADAKLWRDPQLEDALFAPLLKPGFRIEGTLLDNWGNILPRIGFINQLGDYKAAAVLALRAADIATLPLQPHVYWPLPSFSCGIECYVWPSHEDDFLDVKYQEVYPIVSTTAKPTWGSIDPPLSPPIGQAQYQVGGGDYVWVMWRRYRGCIQDNGAFMGSIDF